MNRAGKLSFAYSLLLLVGLQAPSFGQTAPQQPVLGQPNPRAVSLYNLGLTAYKQGSPESAIIFFKRACDIDANLADAQYNLGVIFQLQKRYKEAQPRFEEVLRIKPTDPDAHYQLGLIMKELGRTAEARQHLMAIAPNNNHYAEAQKHLAQLNNPTADLPSVADGSAVRDTGAGNPYASTSVYGQAQPTAPLTQQPGGYPAAGYQPGQGYATQPPAQQLPAAFVPPAAQVAYPPAATAALAASSSVASGTGASPSGSNTASAVASSAVSPAVSSEGPVPKAANASLRIIATGFSAPSGLAFDRSGNLYVANYMTNSIDRINQDGTRSTFCSGANIRGPIGLVVDESNNVYVANYNGGTVAKISPAGVSLVIASGFKKPYYLTLDRDGNLYVSQQEDNSIVRINLPRAVGSK